MSASDEVRACKIAQVDRAIAIQRIHEAIDRILRSHACKYCCARKGKPCATRSGYVLMRVHIMRHEELTPQQHARKDRLYMQLHRVMNGR